jgi:subtilisin-like proprotein convertase family protein
MSKVTTEVTTIFVRLHTGTRVQLLSPRKLDQSNKGFVNWKLMSVLSWGEQPSGTWVLEIIDQVRKATKVSFVYAYGKRLRSTRGENGL